MITEQNAINGLSESFLIDKWCYLGSYQSDGYNHDTKLENKLVFDHDIYKILRRYLSDPRHRSRIKQVSYEQLHPNSY